MLVALIFLACINFSCCASVLSQVLSSTASWRHCQRCQPTLGWSQNGKNMTSYHCIFLVRRATGSRPSRAPPSLFEHGHHHLSRPLFAKRSLVDIATRPGNRMIGFTRNILSPLFIPYHLRVVSTSYVSRLPFYYFRSISRLKWFRESNSNAFAKYPGKFGPS